MLSTCDMAGESRDELRRGQLCKRSGRSFRRHDQFLTDDVRIGRIVGHGVEADEEIRARPRVLKSVGATRGEDETKHLVCGNVLFPHALPIPVSDQHGSPCRGNLGAALMEVISPDTAWFGNHNVTILLRGKLAGHRRFPDHSAAINEGGESFNRNIHDHETPGEATWVTLRKTVAGRKPGNVVPGPFRAIPR